MPYLYFTPYFIYIFSKRRYHQYTWRKRWKRMAKGIHYNTKNIENNKTRKWSYYIKTSQLKHWNTEKRAQYRQFDGQFNSLMSNMCLPSLSVMRVLHSQYSPNTICDKGRYKNIRRDFWALREWIASQICSDFECTGCRPILWAWLHLLGRLYCIFRIVHYSN